MKSYLFNRGEYKASDEEIDALQSYLRDSSFFNLPLRGSGNGPSAVQSKYIATLGNLLKEMPPLASAITVYRAVSREQFTDGFPSMLPTNGMEIGSSWIDPGYVSTSKNKEVIEDLGFTHERERVRLRIRVPSGMHVIDVDQIIQQSDNAKAKRLSMSESEVLLPRGRKFTIFKKTSNLLWVNVQ